MIAQASVRAYYRIYSADFKMDIYLKIARLYLEEQNHISAEAYINRAALLQSEVTNKELHIIYKVIHANNIMLHAIYDIFRWLKISSMAHTFHQV